MKGNKIFDFSRKGFQDIINIMTKKINECVDVSNGLIPTLDEYITKVDWNKIINSDLYEEVLNDLDKTNEQMKTNMKYLNVRKDKTGLLKIRELMKNSLKYNDKLTYIIVGDSTRASRGAIIYNYMKEKLLPYNIDVKMVAKSGLKAEHWSKTTVNLQEGFPTVDDVISIIDDDGSSVIVDICLGINDIDYKTVTEVKQYIMNGINLIKAIKPNTNFVLTSPNARENQKSNIKTKQVYDEMVDENNFAYINVLENVFKSYEEANSDGYMDDTTHPNMDGQRKMFNYIINNLIDSETLINANKRYPIFKNKITLQGTGGECNIYGVLQLINGSVVNLKLKNTKGTWYIYNGDETNSCSTGFTKNGLHFLDAGYSSTTSLKGYIYIDNLPVLTETYDISLNSFISDNISFSQINYLDVNNKVRILKGEPDETHFNYNVFKDVGMRLEVIGHSGDIYIKKVGNQIRLVPDGAGYDYIGNNISCIQKGYSYFEDNVKGVKAWLYVANPHILNSIGNNYYCKFKNFSVSEFTKEKRITDVLMGL